jgi:hypothetical protein
MGTAVAKVPTLSELATDINENYELAASHYGQSFEHIVKAGLLIAQAKRQVGHGEWAKWVKANLKFGVRQASNYMKIANAPAEMRNGVSDLSLRKAIHELAVRSGRLVAQLPEQPDDAPEPKGVIGDEDWNELVRQGREITGYRAGDGNDPAEADDDEPRAEEEAKAPEPQQSWLAEAVSMDGKVWRSGARFQTREEAQIYIEFFARHEVEGFATAAVLGCDDGDRPRQSITRRRSGGKPTLNFEHGTCHMLEWSETATPSSETVEAAQAAANAWQKLTNELRKKQASTLPHDGRSEETVGDPIPKVRRVYVKTEPADLTPTRVYVKADDADDAADIGDIPAHLDRRRARIIGGNNV